MRLFHLHQASTIDCITSATTFLRCSERDIGQRSVNIITRRRRWKNYLSVADSKMSTWRPASSDHFGTFNGSFPAKFHEFSNAGNRLIGNLRVCEAFGTYQMCSSWPHGKRDSGQVQSVVAKKVESKLAARVHGLNLTALDLDTEVENVCNQPRALINDVFVQSAIIPLLNAAREHRRPVIPSDRSVHFACDRLGGWPRGVMNVGGVVGVVGGMAIDSIVRKWASIS